MAEEGARNNFAQPLLARKDLLSCSVWTVKTCLSPIFFANVSDKGTRIFTLLRTFENVQSTSGMFSFETVKSYATNAKSVAHTIGSLLMSTMPMIED